MVESPKYVRIVKQTVEWAEFVLKSAALMLSNYRNYFGDSVVLKTYSMDCSPLMELTDRSRFLLNHLCKSVKFHILVNLHSNENKYILYTFYLCGDGLMQNRLNSNLRTLGFVWIPSVDSF